jgi:GH24 family phage-related lysozyme (muramidase)
LIHADALTLIEEQETFQAEPYDDGGTLAQGFGHRVGPPEVIPGTVWTIEYAREVLQADIAERIRPLDRWLDERSIRLTERQHGALASFIFNRGWGNFLKTKLATVLQNKDLKYHLIKVTCHFTDEENCLEKGVFRYGLKQRRILEAALFHPFNQPKET